MSTHPETISKMVGVFVQIVNLGLVQQKVSKETAVKVTQAEIEKLILVLCAERDRGAPFQFSEFQQGELQLAVANRDCLEELAEVLEWHAYFLDCVRTAKTMPALQSLFWQHSLGAWLEIPTEKSLWRPHVLRFYELFEDWLQEGSLVTLHAIRLLELFSGVYEVPLTYKLWWLVCFGYLNPAYAVHH